jgi:serralysin
LLAFLLPVHRGTGDNISVEEWHLRKSQRFAGDTAFNSTAKYHLIQGQTNVAVWNPQLKLFGLLSPNDTTTDDSSATFATDINPNYLVGVALHELTHALGRVPYGSSPDIFDFSGLRAQGPACLRAVRRHRRHTFRLMVGVTKIADDGQGSDPSDFLTSGIQGANDPFEEFYGSSTLQQLTARPQGARRAWLSSGAGCGARSTCDLVVLAG